MPWKYGCALFDQIRGALAGESCTMDEKDSSSVAGNSVVRNCILSLGAIFLLSDQAAATLTTDYNRTITVIGSQGGQGFLALNTPPSAGCSFDTIYIDLGAPSGQFYMSIALTARIGHLPTQIDYTKDAGGTCWVNILRSDRYPQSLVRRKYAIHKGSVAADHRRIFFSDLGLPSVGLPFKEFGRATAV
jgi:hypothetical protein